MGFIRSGISYPLNVSPNTYQFYPKHNTFPFYRNPNTDPKCCQSLLDMGFFSEN